MHIKLALITCLILLSVTTVVGQTEAELQMMYRSFTEGQDYESWIDSDGDVQFKRGEFTYFIEVNEDDLEFFRMVLPNIWPIESELERLQAQRAVNEANTFLKVVKLYTVDDDVWVGIENLHEDVSDFEVHFSRYLSLIDSGVERFVSVMEEN